MESYRVQLARLYERSPFYRNKLQAAGFASPQAAGGVERRLAFANVFRLTSGYRLIVGRDIEDRRELARMVRSAMLWGLGVMALFGIGEVLASCYTSKADPILNVGRTVPNREEWGHAWKAILRGTGIGFIIGVLPAAGATIASFVS